MSCTLTIPSSKETLNRIKKKKKRLCTLFRFSDFIMTFTSKKVFTKETLVVHIQ